MSNTKRFALTCVAIAAVTGCAQGAVDDENEPLAEPTLVLEAVTTDLHDVPVLTANMLQERTITEISSQTEAVMMEAEACDAVVTTYHMHGLDIGCATTTHVCPDMLRFAFGQECLQYETDTVMACKQRIEDTTSCEELWQMSCDLVPVPNSAPQGCTATEPY